MSDLRPLGEGLPAFLSTLAADLRRAQERGIGETIQNQHSPAEVKMREAFDRLGLEPEQQYPIGQFNADFYFPAVQLVVEVDGKWHAERRDHDRKRDEILLSKGIRTVRITGAQVARDADACAREVRRIIDRLQLEQLGTD